MGLRLKIIKDAEHDWCWLLWFLHFGNFFVFLRERR